jgi:hypothetical protein
MPQFDLRKPRSLAIVWCCWVAAAIAGLGLLGAYARTPGARQHAPEYVANQNPKTRPSLVMFIHPQCPCSSASVEELNHILARCPGKAAVQVFAVMPPGADLKWADAPLIQRAREIPGVQVKVDDRAQESRRLGVETSGHVLLYDAHGNLRFTGGITPSRGHVGDSAGSDAIISILNGEPQALGKAPTQTDVFGCALSSRTIDNGKDSN